MKFGKLGVWITAIFLAAMLASTVTAESESRVVSPGLDVLASGMTMKKSGLVNNDITFEAGDFEKSLNVSTVSSVTITELPARSDGVLYLGGGEVSVGQTVSRENLGSLCFVFAGEEIQSSSFGFRTNHGEHEMLCQLMLLKYENTAPTVSDATETALNVGTYRDITVYGRLDAFDPEGDRLVYEIVEYPKKGILVMENVSLGEYRYMPFSGYTGNDSFRYVVCDEAGNYSESAKVELRITEAKNRLVYADMTESEAHVPAISLTERGIMTASVVNDKNYFEPSKTVTRLEFLVAAMKTLENDTIPESAETVFDDNETIPKLYRGYVALAAKKGYICGKIGENGALLLEPNVEITRAEAAVILSRMLDIPSPVIKPVFADEGSIPAWAREAVTALTSVGVLDCRDGHIHAELILTRAEQARMLYQIGRIA